MPTILTVERSALARSTAATTEAVLLGCSVRAVWPSRDPPSCSTSSWL
ncbi:hypothetical protein [Nocardioides daphniae]|nr:hypothetical protein [Nocardioides daphniae]